MKYDYFISNIWKNVFNLFAKLSFIYYFEDIKYGRVDRKEKCAPFQKI